MNRSSWQSKKKHGRSRHPRNPWLRQQELNERLHPGAQESPPDPGPDDAASSSTSSTSAGSSVPELPGFYYDPEKNRYFRLLPGHNNCNPLTVEGIRQKEMESKRLQLLKEDDKQEKKVARKGFNTSSFLQKRQLGFLSVTSYCRLAHELRLSCMQRKKVHIRSSDPSALASDRFNLILVSARGLCGTRM